jgi:hypothetical protein
MKTRGVSSEKVIEIKEHLFDRANSLASNPKKGQLEEYLEHLKEDHRRIIEHHFKIIYKIVDESIYITDFFDSRQNPEKMKG